MIQDIVSWYLDHVTYTTVFIFMAIESSFIPFPSEVIIPPAAYLAAQGDLNLALVIISGTLGALTGAFFNYYLAWFLGRKIIYNLANTRLAHLLLINEKSVQKSEEYFNKYGNISTLIGRLVPAVRQLISIPAGLSRMKLSNFVLYTTIGSLSWNIILAVLGYFLFTQKELLNRYYKDISIGLIIVGVLFVSWLIYKNFKRSKNK